MNLNNLGSRADVNAGTHPSSHQAIKFPVWELALVLAGIWELAFGNSRTLVRAGLGNRAGTRTLTLIAR